MISVIVMAEFINALPQSELFISMEQPENEVSGLLTHSGIKTIISVVRSTARIKAKGLRGSA